MHTEAMIDRQVIHTHPWLVLASVLSLAYLTTVLPLTFSLTKHGVFPAPEQQKLSILLQQYVLTWGLLVCTTSVLTIGGSYFITVWNALVLVGCILACAEGMTGARGYEDEAGIIRQRRYVRGIRYDAGENRHQDAENSHRDEGEVEDPEPTEITPLVAQRGESTQTAKEQGAIGWWIAQLLVVIPLPVILASHIMVIILLGMNQTLTDGGSPYLGECFNMSYDAFTLVTDGLCSIWDAISSGTIRHSSHRALRYQHASLAECFHPRRLCPVNTVYLSRIPIFSRDTIGCLFCPKRGLGHVARGHSAHWATSIPVERNYSPFPIRI